MRLLDICCVAEDKNAKQDMGDAAARLPHPRFRAGSGNAGVCRRDGHWGPPR